MNTTQKKTEKISEPDERGGGDKMSGMHSLGGFGRWSGRPPDPTSAAWPRRMGPTLLIVYAFPATSTVTASFAGLVSLTSPQSVLWGKYGRKGRVRSTANTTSIPHRRLLTSPAPRHPFIPVAIPLQRYETLTRRRHRHLHPKSSPLSKPFVGRGTRVDPPLTTQPRNALLPNNAQIIERPRGLKRTCK